MMATQLEDSGGSTSPQELLRTPRGFLRCQYPHHPVQLRHPENRRSHMLDKSAGVPVPLILPKEPPSQAEIDVVLLTVDALPGKLDRKDIVFILKGSRRSRALFNQWYKLETFGVMHHLDDYRIGSTVDWCIHDGWLRLMINREGRIAVYFAEKGWERNKEIWRDRVLEALETWAENGRLDEVWPRLRPIHPEIKAMVIDALRQREGISDDLRQVLAEWAAGEERPDISSSLQELLAEA